MRAGVVRSSAAGLSLVLVLVLVKAPRGSISTLLAAVPTRQVTVLAYISQPASDNPTQPPLRGHAPSISSARSAHHGPPGRGVYIWYTERWRPDARRAGGGTGAG